MFDPDTLDALEALAETAGCSKGEIVRLAVRKEIDRHKKISARRPWGDANSASSYFTLRAHARASWSLSLKRRKIRVCNVQTQNGDRAK